MRLLRVPPILEVVLVAFAFYYLVKCKINKIMSLFKVKPWWSNQKLRNEPVKHGLQNFNSLKVDKFSAHSDSDCIIVGEGELLTIYKPNGSDDDAANVLLELTLEHPILHIETGKYTTNTDDRQILILHPQSYSIYYLQKKEGHTDAGVQNFLGLAIKHTFTRKAHSLITGPFGGTKTRDLICVQALDGSLSFFDQDTFLFICVFNDVIVPGPVAYVTSSDMFVLCKSTWVIEIYSYQQLRDFGELNQRTNKKNIPQWTYNAGEEISALQVVQTSNNFSSIIALGERYLYCFQDNGLMKFSKKFDFSPLYISAYLIGWYYEASARLIIMVASEDAKLFIYEGTSLLWSCELLSTPVSMSRCFLRQLPGGVVVLTSDGVVSVCYLGTQPDLTPAGPSIMNEIMDPVLVQQELEHAEKTLQKLLQSTDALDEDHTKLKSILKIKADAGKPTEYVKQEFTIHGELIKRYPSCPMVVVINCEEPKIIHSIQITYVCISPFTGLDNTICLNSVNGTEIIETQILLTDKTDIYDAQVKLLFTITDSNGKIVVWTRNVILPSSIYCDPVATVKLEKPIKLEIQTNGPCANLLELFSDFSQQEMEAQGNKNDSLTLKMKINDKIVTIKSSDQNFYVEAEDFSEMFAILDNLIFKIKEHSTRVNTKKIKINIKIPKDTQMQLIHRFLKKIELHAKERIKMKSFEDELSVLQKQFHLIQKRLLVAYGSSPPADCEALEYLMRDTHQRIVKVANLMLECRDSLCRAGNTMASVGRMITFVLKSKSTEDDHVHLAEEMISLQSLYEDNQDWEEFVTQALAYVLKNMFKNSEKDREKLAPITEQGVLSHINLKRFIRQIRVVLEKMFAEVAESGEIVAEVRKVDKVHKIVRIEEMVEVI